jgi:hypothetical protein
VGIFPYQFRGNVFHAKYQREFYNSSLPSNIKVLGGRYSQFALQLAALIAN